MGRVELVTDHADGVAEATPVRRARDRFRDALADRGLRAEDRDAAAAGGEDATVVRISGASGRASAETLARTGVSVPTTPESFAIVAERDRVVAACGADIRGLVYAMSELADRVEHEPDPLAALRLDRPSVSHPANEVRSVARLFCSEIEDLGWYRDEAFWRRYLSMLVSQRFNRFSLTLGLGYNYPREVTDAYLYFAYPFLVPVRGYDVRIPELPDEERERNLSALRFISDEASALGLEFQLGLWTHAYEWIDSPNAHQTISGLAPETHAAYCRDGIGTLLDACPSISGVTLRIHGESGIPEGSPWFWRTVFEGVRDAGRPVRLDLHAKGLDEATLRAALETGQPVTVSPKFWAEHMGLPYHQAAIRESERVPREDPSDRSEWHRAMRVSEGSRPFTRYGYGDFLQEDRSYDIVFRLWAGTQRLLLWGDPALAAAYGRAASLAGSRGLEWCEPLTFKGREGSGIVGSRTGYADPSLVPAADWEKHAYTYRLFGRLSYDPDTPADGWRRPLRGQFGAAARDAAEALAAASRILPLVTVAHHPSASNNYYWPEIYTDMPIVASDDAVPSHPYLDTPEPRRFGTVSPLDPEVFSSVVGFVEELRAGSPSGRLSPLDVATELDRLADAAARHRDAFERTIVEPDAESRRWSIDIAILAALGRFFAGKLRAAVAYELSLDGRSGVLGWAVAAYRSAVEAWEDASEHGAAYVEDLTFGPQARIRGHWRDRLSAIEADLRAMERLTPREAADPGPDEILGRTSTVERPSVEHRPPDVFRADEDLELALKLAGEAAGSVEEVALRYRAMNQSLPVSSREMERQGAGFVVRIPGGELDGRYPLSYAFILRSTSGDAWRHPGLGEELSEQPYHVVRSSLARSERLGATPRRAVAGSLAPRI